MTKLVAPKLSIAQAQARLQNRHHLLMIQKQCILDQSLVCHTILNTKQDKIAASGIRANISTTYKVGAAVLKRDEARIRVKVTISSNGKHYLVGAEVNGDSPKPHYTIEENLTNAQELHFVEVPSRGEVLFSVEKRVNQSSCQDEVAIRLFNCGPVKTKRELFCMPCMSSIYQKTYFATKSGANLLILVVLTKLNAFRVFQAETDLPGVWSDTLVKNKVDVDLAGPDNSRWYINQVAFDHAATRLGAQFRTYSLVSFPTQSGIRLAVHSFSSADRRLRQNWSGQPAVSPLLKIPPNIRVNKIVPVELDENNVLIMVIGSCSGFQIYMFLFLVRVNVRDQASRSLSIEQKFQMKMPFADFSTDLECKKNFGQNLVASAASQTKTSIKFWVSVRESTAIASVGVDLQSGQLVAKGCIKELSDKKSRIKDIASALSTVGQPPTCKYVLTDLTAGWMH